MELIYLYIEDYKNIKNQGFNFSSKFTCKYDEVKKTLQIDEKNNHIENFFGENINITAIVGENGSGKSSVLEVLKYGSSNATYFALLFNKTSNSFTICGNFETERTKVKENDLYQQIEEQNFKIDKFNQEKLYNIYLAKNIYEYPESTRDTHISKNLANISDEYFYEKISEDIQEQYSHKLTSFIQIKQLYRDTITQSGLEAFYKAKLSLPKDWKKPSKINIYTTYSYIFTSYDNLLKEKESEQNLYENLLKIKQLYELHNTNGKPHYENNDWKYYIKYLAILNFIVTSYRGAGEEIFRDIIIGSFEKINKNDKNKSIDDMLKYYSNDFKKDGINNSIPKQYFNTALELIELLGDLNKYFKKGFFSIDIEDNIDKILKIIELHKELTITVAGFLQFSLEPIFSDGHQNMFDLFAKFHMAINTLYDNKKPKDNDNIYLFLDEPDGYFHPNWQKQFIAILIDFLETNYKKFTFEIILTSHSPFILSDIPKQNIVFLKDGKQVDAMEKKQTFGANIHTLLADGFFMDGGLMGEFAKSKIEEVIKYLNDKNLEIKSKEEAQKIINIIGEPILKNQLQKMLDSKNLSEVDKIKQDIKALQNRLEELENGKN